MGWFSQKFWRNLKLVTPIEPFYITTSFISVFTSFYCAEVDSAMGSNGTCKVGTWIDACGFLGYGAATKFWILIVASVIFDSVLESSPRRKILPSKWGIGTASAPVVFRFTFQLCFSSVIGTSCEKFIFIFRHWLERCFYGCFWLFPCLCL